jgi:hypothetical protein
LNSPSKLWISFFDALSSREPASTSLENAPTARKIACSVLAGLARQGENRYIRRNLWFSYDRVLRVGPSGPALFYYLNGAGAGITATARSGDPATTPKTS